jgi:hypothetical protein
MAPSSWPHPHHPIVDGQPSTETVEVFLHRPDLTDELVAWSGGKVVTPVNGGPVVVVPGRDNATKRIVGLGDYAVKVADKHFHASPAAGFATRYQPEGDG